MRSTALILSVALATSVLAQAASTYHITHTYTLGGDGSWDYIVPDPPNHRLFIARQNRVMVVDENTGTLLGEVTGINGAHGTAIATASGHGFATSGNDQSGRDVRLEDVQGARAHPRGRGRRRDCLRQRLEPRVHAERRRALVDGHRSGRHARHQHSARRQARIRPAGRRRQGLREPHGRERGRRNRRQDGDGHAALVHRAVQAAGVDGHRHRASSAVQRVPQRRDGRVGLPGRQGRRDAADRHRRRRRGYDPASADAFASNVDGTLTVIHQDSPDQYHVAETVQTAQASRNMGLDPTNHRIFIAAAKFGPAPAGGRGRGPVLPGSFAVLVVERDRR